MSDHYLYIHVTTKQGLAEISLERAPRLDLGSLRTHIAYRLYVSLFAASLIISHFALAHVESAHAQGIASVNDEPVNYQHYQSHYQRLLQTHPHAAGNAKLERILAQRALLPLVVERLLRQEAARLKLDLEKITHSDPIVKLKNKHKSTERLQAYLKRVGETEQTLRLKSWSAAVTRALMRSSGLLTVAEDQLRAEYERLSSRFRQPERIRAWQVLFEIEDASKPEDVKGAKDRADQVYEKLTRGNMTFQFAVRRHSSGPLKFKQGDLGFIRRGQLIQSVEDAIWSLKRGEISAPVRSQYGWHIIRRGQRLAPVDKTFESVKESLKERLEGRLFHRKRRGFVKGLWQKAKIKSEISLSY